MTLPELIDVRMDEIRNKIGRLNEVADVANRIVEQMEATLVNDSKAGLVVETSAFDSHKEDGARWTEHLAFRRLNNRWRICVVIKYDHGWEAVHWDQCSRDTKLQAFEKIPELLEAMRAKVGNLLDLADRIPKMLGMSS